MLLFKGEMKENKLFHFCNGELYTGLQFVEPNRVLSSNHGKEHTMEEVPPAHMTPLCEIKGLCKNSKKKSCDRGYKFVRGRCKGEYHNSCSIGICYNYICYCDCTFNCFLLNVMSCS